MFYKCKMCGGTLEIKNNDTVGVCEYCGTKQTLPRLDNDKKANLYERAAHFRQLNDYDRAMTLYEQVLAEDKTDAEAYWSIVLCRYGIEYVEDPTSHKRIPTINRMQYTSVFDDSDFKDALLYSDTYQSEIYRQEAEAIDDIRTEILNISENEEPFDIFICYKESDDTGRRTVDSVIAYDVYKELVEAGYKVFFSRITLEDKIGTAYEPYIFAALNSATIMLVIGTKPEYFNAVWVKNEWSRFLGMIKTGAKKNLIPMYKDISPYELPEEFAHLQAQDMNNLGYMQDLLRGIEKMINKNSGKSGEVGKMQHNTTKNKPNISKKLKALLRSKAFKTVAVVSAILLSVFAIGICIKVVIPEKKYKAACSLIEQHDYEGAIAVFNTVSEYKDAKQKIIDCERQKIKETYRNLNIGDVAELGNSGSYSCRWIVLDKDENKILLFNQDGLVPKVYGDTGVWEESEVRAWLNNEYIKSNFSKEEQQIIITTDIKTQTSHIIEGRSESDTQDKIWLLSIEEAKEYFDSDTDRQCFPDSSGRAWWLRSSGERSYQNAAVREDGSICESGLNINQTNWIRPALYVDISY